MRKIWILVVAIVLCFVCLTSCSNNDTDNSNDTTNGDTNNSNNSTDISTGNVDVAKFDLQNVENLQCQIRFGQTGEEFIFEKEKALQLYNIISSYDYTKLNEMLCKSSVNPFKDYVYVYFTGDSIISEEFPFKEYGHFTIYIDDIVAHNLSVYMSSIHYYQYEDGLYDQVCQYIVENSKDAGQMQPTENTNVSCNCSNVSMGHANLIAQGHYFATKTPINDSKHINT